MSVLQREYAGVSSKLPAPAGFKLKYREDKYGHKQSSCSEQPLVSVLYKEFPTANNA